MIAPRPTLCCLFWIWKHHRKQSRKKHYGMLEQPCLCRHGGKGKASNPPKLLPWRARPWDWCFARIITALMVFLASARVSFVLIRFFLPSTNRETHLTQSHWLVVRQFLGVFFPAASTVDEVVIKAITAKGHPTSSMKSSMTSRNALKRRRRNGCSLSTTFEPINNVDQHWKLCELTSHRAVRNLVRHNRRHWFEWIIASRPGYTWAFRTITLGHSSRPSTDLVSACFLSCISVHEYGLILYNWTAHDISTQKCDQADWSERNYFRYEGLKELRALLGVQRWEGFEWVSAIITIEARILLLASVVIIAPSVFRL